MSENALSYRNSFTRLSLTTSPSTLSLLSPTSPSSGRAGATSLVQAGHRHRSNLLILIGPGATLLAILCMVFCSPKSLYCSFETKNWATHMGLLTFSAKTYVRVLLQPPHPLLEIRAAVLDSATVSNHTLVVVE